MNNATLVILGTLISTLIATYLAHRLEVSRNFRTSQKNFANELIKEYFSPPFLQTRAAVWELQRLVQSEEVDIKAVAAGFYRNASTTYYSGKTYRETHLTMHEHLTLYLSFCRRVGFAIENNLVEAHQLSLLEDINWNVYLINSLRNEILESIKQTQQKQHLSKDDIPAEITSINLVLSLPFINPYYFDQPPSLLAPDHIDDFQK